MYYSTELGTFEKDGAKYHVRFVGSIYELESESPQSMCPCKEYPSSNHYYGNEPHIRCEHLDDQGKILKFFEVSGEMTLNNKSNIELFKEQKVTYFSDFEEKDVFRAIEVSFNSIHDRYKLSEDIHLALVSKLIFQSYDEYAGEFPENGIFYRDKMVSIFNDKGIPYDDTDRSPQMCRQSDYKFVVDIERTREENGHDNTTRYELLPSWDRMEALDSLLSNIAFKSIFKKSETRDLSLDF